MPIRTEGIDHVALAVTDVVRSAAWYCDLLGLERRFEQEWGNFPAMHDIRSVTGQPWNASDPRQQLHVGPVQGVAAETDRGDLARLGRREQAVACLESEPSGQRA